MILIYTSTGNICSCFFWWGLISAVTVSGAGRNIFLAVEGLQFLTQKSFRADTGKRQERTIHGHPYHVIGTILLKKKNS